MKVVYILSSATKYGGATKSFVLMLNGLRKKGINPIVILPENGGICDFFEKNKIQYVVYPFYISCYPPIKRKRDSVLFFPRLLRMLLLNKIAEKKIYTYLLRCRPDIIHTNVGPIHVGYNVAKKLRIPHVWHLREYQTLDFSLHPFFSMRGFYKKIHSSNNYCIAITKGIYDFFSLDEKSKMIYNGIVESGNLKFISNKEKYFLFAGRLEPNKGILNLIMAFAEFAKIDTQYKLYVAGDTIDTSFNKLLTDTVAQYKLDDRVVFLGMRDDIYDIMSVATALVVPSLSEGFGRITIEAMYNGCLVIGYNNAGTKEILSTENLGILYDTQDELIETLVDIANNGIEKWVPVMKKAQQQVRKLYSQEQNVEAVYELYNDILK